MRKLLAGLILLALCAALYLPGVCYTEDVDTVRLARAIYALGKTEDHDTKLMLGTVAMNRADSPWFKGDLGEVLSDQQQFPAGTRYDEASLRAAHELIAGARALPADALYYQAADDDDSWGAQYRVAQSGNYQFYARKGIL